MTNPLNRGSAPGRERSADQRSGSFKQGHEKRGGRKSGTQNLLSIDFKRGIFEAAYRIGLDGNGKDGIVGYFSWIAERHPRIYGTVLLANILLVEYAESNTPEELRRAIDENSEEVRDYIGLTSKNRVTEQPIQVEEPPWAWTGQPFPVGSLMQLAVESPKDFCTLCAAAFLRPPPKRRTRATRQVG
jgi:hypothetical protein